MRLQRILLGLLLGLAACSGQGPTPNLPTFQSACPAGTTMRAIDSKGSITYLRSPVVQDDLAVLTILQQSGGLPVQNGDELLKAVDAARVKSYHGPGFALWYFPKGTKLPSALPWVDSQGNCMGSSPVVYSEDFPNWVYVKVPHWAHVNVPTNVLIQTNVCVRAKDFPVVHQVQLGQGSFAGLTGVICSMPDRAKQIIAQGYNGVHMVFVTSSTAPATPGGGVPR